MLCDFFQILADCAFDRELCGWSVVNSSNTGPKWRLPSGNTKPATVKDHTYQILGGEIGLSLLLWELLYYLKTTVISFLKKVEKDVCMQISILILIVFIIAIFPSILIYCVSNSNCFTHGKRIKCQSIKISLAECKVVKIQL